MKNLKLSISPFTLCLLPSLLLLPLIAAESAPENMSPEIPQPDEWPDLSAAAQQDLVYPDFPAPQENFEYPDGSTSAVSPPLTETPTPAAPERERGGSASKPVAPDPVVAEVLAIRARLKLLNGKSVKKAPKPLVETQPPAVSVKAPPPTEPGYTTVLTGVLEKDLELGPENSPVLIRGTLTVPPICTLKLKPGVVLHLKAAPSRQSASEAGEKAEKPARSGAPDPTRSAVIWLLGTLLIQGKTGNPVEILNQEKEDAALLLYSSNQSKIEGARLKGVTITQSGGACLWTNCEFVNMSHYALASGAGLFTQCSFKNCGGIFATYNLAPWALLVRKSLFDACRDGVILGSDPDENCLIVEKNHFVNTRGAHIRAMPAANASGKADAKSKAAETEILIGENWYGPAQPEEIDLRIVDRRTDPGLRIRLNTRPPADAPYPNVGAGVSAEALAAALREQQSAQEKMLKVMAKRVAEPQTAQKGKV